VNLSTTWLAGICLKVLLHVSYVVAMLTTAELCCVVILYFTCIASHKIQLFVGYIHSIISYSYLLLVVALS
jgi:hypothetical protein